MTKPMFGEKLKKFTDQILGRRLRDHEVGPAIDMDYQPYLVPCTPTLPLKQPIPKQRSYASVVK